MATADYPAYLPKPVRDNYNIEHVSPFVRTPMVTGRARQRRTFESTPSIITVNWYMNDTLAQLFEAWFKYGITDGADWFYIDLKTPTGNFAPYECRFTEMYDGPTIDDARNWKFGARLEIRERPVLGKEYWLYGQQFILGADIIDKAINREWPKYVFDYSTYAELLAASATLPDGTVSSIKRDETRGGNRSVYRVSKIVAESLLLDFSRQVYAIAETPGIYLVETWPY